MTLQLTPRTPASVATPLNGPDVFADSTDGNKPKYKDTAGVLHSFASGGYQAFNPRDYGAVDPTGVANSNAAFTAAVAAWVASNARGYLQLEAGVYLVNTGIITGLTSNPGAVVGPDRGICVLIPQSATGDFITVPAAVDGFSCQGFAIYQTGSPNTAGAGINTNGGDDVNINNMLFVNLFNDVSVNGTSIKVSITKTVHSQANGSATSVAVLVNNGAAGDTYIGPDVVMSNTGNTRRRASVEVIASGHFEINQCNLTGSAQGLLIDPGAGQIVAFGFINQSLFDSCSVNGASITAPTATSTVKSIKSVNSWYCGTVVVNGSAAAAGCLTSGTAGGIINGVTHIGDRFLNNQTHGYQHGFGTDFRWEACDMKGNSAAGANANDGLNVAAAVSNWSVIGGKYGGTDTAATGGNQRWGINVVAGASNNYAVIGADLTGNTSGPLTDNGTGTVKRFVGNIGMDPVAVLITTPATVAAVETVVHQVALPVGALQVGATYRVKAWGTISATAAGTILARIRLGTAGTTGDAAVAATAAAGAAVGAVGWTIDAIMTVRSVGAGGTVVGNIGVIVNATAAQLSAQTATVAAVTTSALFLSLTVIGGGTAPVITVVDSIIEPVAR